MRNALTPRSEQTRAQFFGLRLTIMELAYNGWTERWFRTKLLQTSLRLRGAPCQVDLLAR
jgi:hypothetical protein